MLIAATFVASFGGGVWFSRAANTALAGVVVLNIAMLAYVFTDIRRRIPCCFFRDRSTCFCSARVYVSWIRDYENRLQLLEGETFESIYWSIQMLAISLQSSIWPIGQAVFCCAAGDVACHTGARRILDNPIIPIVRQLSRWALYVSSLASFFFSRKYHPFRAAERLSDLVYGDGRCSLQYKPVFPLFHACVCRFLATMPSGKQLRLPMCVYGVYLLASLFTGRRNTIVTNLLMLALYAVLRDNLLPKEKRILTKRLVALVCVLGVGGVYLLQMVAYIRSGSAGGGSLLNTLVSFIDSQGASFRVMVKTFDYGEYLDTANGWRYLSSAGTFPEQQLHWAVRVSHHSHSHAADGRVCGAHLQLLPCDHLSGGPGKVSARRRLRHLLCCGGLCGVRDRRRDRHQRCDWPCFFAGSPVCSVTRGLRQRSASSL